MEWILLTIYGLTLLFIFLFSLTQFHLSLLYRKNKNPQHPVDELPEQCLPVVTVQLPVFNERYVIDRLIDSIAQLDYPKDKLEVQVLDDSTDDTTEKARLRVTYWRSQGLDITLVRRPDRKGFKAGALQYGLEQARGEYVAIFDADFLPKSDFLKNTVAHLVAQPEVGLVQTRWGHLNRNYSLLTRLQAFGLDGHFTVEQGGRSQAGSFINFNGTGGVWRKACIEAAGGWTDDTLTEDLDLSYRAQIKGWKFQYLESVEAPAELPVLMPAVKSQQFRWNKGGAECARKHVKNIFRVNHHSFSLKNRIHAFFHLFNSTVFSCLLVSALLSIPVLYIKDSHPELRYLFHAASIFVLGFFAITYFYWIASSARYTHKNSDNFFVMFPLFMVVSMGMSWHNTLAVTEGLLGIKTPFHRTPKFNILTSKDTWQKNVYINKGISWSLLFEMALMVYFLYGIYVGISLGDYGLVLFHAMLSLGFGLVVFFTVKQQHFSRVPAS